MAQSTLYTICIVLFVLLAYLLSVLVSYYNPAAIPIAEWRKTTPPFATNNDKNIFWFVQVSDIHISRYLDPKRSTDFESFCTKTLDIINPDVVMVTGDLTDAKHRNRIGSEQYIDEWETYESILRRSKAIEKYVWLDIRGNHDAFNVIDINDPSNFYKKYSGDKGRRTSQSYHHIKPFGTYSFIPVDATLVPGPKRPFNFIGHINKQGINNLDKWATESYQSNYTIWYGHYPTCSITSESTNFREVLGRRGGVYLSGHFHESGGLAKKMHAMQPAGYLELEVGDWMNNRRFRVIAIDHDLLSFTGAKFNEWPLILVTNPKAATYMTPRHEPIGRMIHSTHIRFLIFHEVDISEVNVLIDGNQLSETAKRVNDGPLWVCSWDSSLYTKKTHQLQIKVLDVNGKTKIKTETFSLDKSWKSKFDFFAVFILVTDFCSVFRVCHYILSFIGLFILLEAKFQIVQYTGGQAYQKIKCFLRDNITFYIIFAFWINLLLGPWFIGELIDGHIGVTFPFGLLLDKKLFPEHILYVYGLVKIFLFYSPPLLYLSYCNWIRQVNNITFWKTFNTTLCPNIRYLHGAAFLHTIVHFFWVRALFGAYGAMALIFSPARLWWFLAEIYLYYRVWKKREHA